MLDSHFSPAQKAAVITSILREQQHGADLRECCRAQGLTVQTFLSWKNQALRHNAFDLHLATHEEVNGNRAEPERAPRPAREVDGNRAEPKTAMQLALERARAAAHDDEEPDEEPEPSAEPQAPAQAAPPAPTEEPAPMPKVADAEPVLSKRAAALIARFPWLPKVEERTTAQLGFAKPDNTKSKPYVRWCNTRLQLMTDKQREAWSTFYNRNPSGQSIPRRTKTAEQTELAAAIASNAQAAVEVPKPKKKLGRPRKVFNGQSGPITPQAALAAPTLGHEEPTAPTLAELVEQQQRLDNAIQSHPAHGPFATLRSQQPGNAAEAEIDRLRRALAVLTLENLQLRGLL